MTAFLNAEQRPRPLLVLQTPVRLPAMAVQPRNLCLLRTIRFDRWEAHNQFAVDETDPKAFRKRIPANNHEEHVFQFVL